MGRDKDRAAGCTLKDCPSDLKLIYLDQRLTEPPNDKYEYDEMFNDGT
jgi:hypothetical protein